MSYKFSFADSEVYTATDVNAITKRLVTSGVEDIFTDGVAYNVSKFNEAGKLLYTSGVVSEDCDTLKVTKVNDSEILINPGSAFFGDGAFIEIEVGGETLSFVSGSKNYVYLQNDLINTNRCYPVCSVNGPTGDFVPLAEIDENGKIDDKRTYAMGKLPGYQSVAGNPLFFKETMKVTLTSNIKGSGYAEFYIGNNAYQYILFTNLTGNGKGFPNLSLYNISDGSVTSFYRTRNSNNTANIDTSGPIHVYTENDSPYEKHDITVSFEDGVLKINATVSCQAGWSTDLGKAGDKVKIDLNLIFI